MKDRIINANFPRTADQRVYHLGIRHGEVANRVVTLGAPSRAHTLATFFDPTPRPFTLSSERGFLTITGRYKGVPISICSIGMGYPNMDFFVREVRECVEGDLAIVRLGSCGALVDVKVGTIAAPRAAVAITRNYDYDFASEEPDGHCEPPYRISKPVEADSRLHEAVAKSLQSSDEHLSILADTVNASADSFYSSQGRLTSFPDHNEHLIKHIRDAVPNLATLEMETFHLYHLACSYNPRPRYLTSPPPTSQEPSSILSLSRLPTGPQTPGSIPPVTTNPVQPLLAPYSHRPALTPAATEDSERERGRGRIYAAAAQIIFANRNTQDWIEPAEVARLEAAVGKAVLEALVEFEIPPERIQGDAGSVWDL